MKSAVLLFIVVNFIVIIDGSLPGVHVFLSGALFFIAWRNLLVLMMRRLVFVVLGMLVFFAAPAIASNFNYTCKARWYHAPFNAESTPTPEIRSCSLRDKIEAAGNLRYWSGYLAQKKKVYFVTKSYKREEICPSGGPGNLVNAFIPRCWSHKRYNDSEEREYYFVSDDVASLKPVPVVAQPGEPEKPENTEKRNLFAVIGESVFYKGRPIPNADAKSFELVLDVPKVLRELTIAQDRNSTYVFRYAEPTQVFPRLSLNELDWVSYQCATRDGCPKGVVSGMFRVGSDGYWVGWHSAGFTVFPNFAKAGLKCYFEGEGDSGGTNYCVHDKKITLISQRGNPENPVLVRLDPITAQSRYVCPPANVNDADSVGRREAIVRKEYKSWYARGDVKVLPAETDRRLRIAAAYGSGWARDTLKEHFERHFGKQAAKQFLRELFELGVAAAGYDLAWELSYSSSEIEQNAAVLTYKKAAEMGDTESMLSTAKILESVHYDPDVIKQIRQCAVNKGDARAMYLFAQRLESQQQYPQALKAYQKAVKMGSSEAALRMASIFGYGGAEMNSEYKQPRDADRAERYYAISRGLLLGYTEEAGKIDEFVPLPPAKLKDWDGKLTRPDRVELGDVTEEMLTEMAKAKGLDPRTGRPL